MPRPPTGKVVLYVKLPGSLRATARRLRQETGAKFLSDVVAEAIERALAEIGRGALLVPVTGEKAIGGTFRLDPDLLQRLDAAAEASGIGRHNIVRAGLALLAREREAVDAREPGN